MKRWIALLLALAALICVCGCQNVSDAYTKKEEQEMKASARSLASDWLSQNMPAAVPGDEEHTYCDIVTDWHKYYLSGYVTVPYELDGASQELIVNPETKQLFTDRDADVINAHAADWMIAMLGFDPDDVVDGGINISAYLPVTYAPTLQVGKFLYSNLQGYFPVEAAADPDRWLQTPAKRDALEVSCSIVVKDGTDLSAFRGALIDRIEEINALQFDWLEVENRSKTVFASLQEEGGVRESRLAFGTLGDYKTQYLACLIEEEPLENGGCRETRTDYDLEQCVRIERSGESLIFRPDPELQHFYCNLTADRELPEMALDWVWDWEDGDVWTLSWLRQSDGSYVLVNSDTGEEVTLWPGGHLIAASAKPAA